MECTTFLHLIKYAVELLKTNIDSFDDVDDALQYYVECENPKVDVPKKSKCESFHSERHEGKGGRQRDGALKMMEAVQEWWANR